MKLQALSSLLEADLDGPSDDAVHSCASLSEAGPGQLAFYVAPASPALLGETRASAVLLSRHGLSVGRPDSCAALVVDDPRASFRRALRLLHPRGPVVPGVDPRAFVDPSAKVGEGVCIGAFAFVGPGVSIGSGSELEPHAILMSEASIGEGCRIGAGAVLRPRVVLGDAVAVQSGAVLGADGFSLVGTPAGQLARVPHLGSVQVGDGSSVGAGSVVARGALADTEIGTGSHLDSLVQVGHGCSIGDGVVLAAQVGLSGSVVLQDGVVLGGQAGVAEGRAVGDGARLAARAGVTRDLPGMKDYAGFPARERWSHWRREAEVGHVGALRHRVSALEAKVDRLTAALETAGRRTETEEA